MVRMGRDETTAPAVRPWHMDAVAERYAERDSNTLKAACKCICHMLGNDSSVYEHAEAMA